MKHHGLSQLAADDGVQADGDSFIPWELESIQFYALRGYLYFLTRYS